MKAFSRTLPAYLALFFVLLFPLVSTESAAVVPTVEAAEGDFDFSAWDSEARPIVQLAGQIRFFWNAFAVSSPHSAMREAWINIPGSWHKSGQYPLHGYATYAFDLISDKDRTVAIDFGLVGLSHRIYVNGELIHANGRPEAMPELFQRASANKIMFSFQLLKGRTRVAIEAANYDYIMSGLGKNIFFGKPEAVMANRFGPMLLAFMLFGAYLAIGLYHFGLYFLRRRDRSSLYFGLFCLTSIPSILVNNEVNCLDLLGTNSVAFAVLLASTLGVSLSFLGLFLSYLYENRLPRFASWVLMGVYVILGAASIIDFKIFLKLLVLLMAVGLPAGGIFIYAIIQAARAKKAGAGLMLISICAVFITAVHDYANFNGWIRSVPLSAFGSLAFLMIQSYLLSARFSRAFTQVEVSEQEVRQLSAKIQAQHDQVVETNENLEQLAEEKTREIRSILSNIQLGIFAIQPERFQIHKDYSQHMQTIFDVPDVSGMNACDLLFSSSSLSSDEKSQASSALEASLGENSLIFQLNAHCLPHELQYMTSAGLLKILELSWHPVTDAADCTEKILVTVRDVTQFRALEEEAQDKKEELQFISELLNVTAENFRRFIRNTDDFIQENRVLVNSQSIQLKDVEVLKLLFINMHTMKGAARSLYLKKMTKVFHDVEQYYAQLQNQPEAHWDVDRMNRDLDEAVAILRTYENINESKLGRKTSGEPEVEIAESQLMLLYRQFLALSSHAFPHGAGSFMSSLEAFFIRTLFTPVQQLLHELCACTETLAKDLKKEKPRVMIQTEDFFVNNTGNSLFRKILIHLLRNSMDHGIEPAAERLRKHKSVMGMISMSVHRQGNEVILLYEDDGRGLDVERIRSIAQDKRLIPHSDSLSMAELGELIFYPGLSTANQVSDVSGRGVGMDAVRSYLQKIGGSVALHFHQQAMPGSSFQAFYFEIRLPWHLFAQTVSPEGQGAA